MNRWLQRPWTQTYRINHYEAKMDMSWLSLGKHKLTFGGSGILYNLGQGRCIALW